ncbi:hypothetical protein PBI_MISSWHITE_42 [Mycobacterium phage MissWhite]|nr:hypothetical protein PBI_MISSWHITE_42 [Mycobacterium phage MissWhite]
MTATWPEWSVVVTNTDPESFETNTAVVSLQSRVTTEQLYVIADANPDVAAAIEAMPNPPTAEEN